MSQALVIDAVHRQRYVVVTWWGNCSYRRLKVTYEIRKMICPLCKHELENARYVGDKVFSFNLRSADYVRDSWLPFLENGKEVWLIADSGDWKICHYGGE
jgi:hypothetical protein